MSELQECIDEALQYSKLDTVLVEEFIEGREFSVESLHYSGNSEVIQFTEKKTTDFPYNVELGHTQPANLTEEQKQAICEIITKISKTLKFDNCPSHTELKINERGIFVIETSPRLGGDYITSSLTFLSTGINIEDQILNIALSRPVNLQKMNDGKVAGVCFFSFQVGKVKDIDSRIEEVKEWPKIFDFKLKLEVGDTIGLITNSLGRYGHFIICADNIGELEYYMRKYEDKIKSYISIERM